MLDIENNLTYHWHTKRGQVSLLSWSFQYDILVDVLMEFKRSIGRVDEQAKKITDGLDKDNADYIREVAGLTIEQLFGGAFVTCQASITAVVSRIKELHNVATESNITINSVPKEKNRLLTFQSPELTAHITQIQAIDALANYFKHNDEWPPGWVNADGRSQATILCLQALGFVYGNDAILRKAIELFDSNLIVLANAINGWHETIVAQLKIELINLRLL